MLNSSQSFRFVKVEEYFADYQKWHRVQEILAGKWNCDTKEIALEMLKDDGSKCCLLFQFPRFDIFRVRFHPEKSTKEDYSSANTRSIVMDNFYDLQRAQLDFKLEVNQEHKKNKDFIQAVTKDRHGNPVMKVVFHFRPFSINVFSYDDGGKEFLVMATAFPGLYFLDSGCPGEHAVIQVVEKPPTAKYVGFGEQGGVDLSKNTAQLTYFNFDNMRYRQVYNRGALDDREPLYHSDPFFMEFYGNPKKESIYGIFVDNPSQICMDIGCLNSKRYMFGTRFGDLDYYFFVGKKCPDIIEAFTSLVGKARLKPRYALGYHQGCYGYDHQKILMDVAEKYRKHQIPIDGLHIDVDLQRNYQTFTVDSEKFPDPQGMFHQLKEQGYKCSTNITPIISNQNTEDYQTYLEAIENDFFVVDRRYEGEQEEASLYHDYQIGKEVIAAAYDTEDNLDSGGPYIGEVYYGGNRGTTGHYADLSKKEVRLWWGKQYQYLFDLGLEMVWQDMTTPNVRSRRGDMRSFPARLMVTNDYMKAEIPAENGADAYHKTPAIKAWNLYSYNLHKATYHGLNHLVSRENKRNFIIGRGCFAGMHRFAGLWTGDNASEWDFLRINITQVLALGLTGQALCGEDIGGFERGADWEKWADPELLIRWTAMGAFLPWFRNHYIAKGIKYFQEPYAYQWVDLETIPREAHKYYQSVLPVCQYYIQLRYRLLQLFYDGLFANTITGMPICRALFLNDTDPALYNDKIQFLNNQFFVGDHLLVAPMVEKEGAANNWGRRDIYLPAGSNWYAFVDNQKPILTAVEGGTTIRDYDARIDNDPEHIGFILPLYVRTGAIIPTLEVEQYVGEKNHQGLPNPLTLNIYPGLTGQYTMYLDDGVSRSSAVAGDPHYGADPQANSEYREVVISHSYLKPFMREIKIERVKDGYTPPYEKYFYLAILHDPAEKVGFSGSLVKVEIAGQEILSLGQGGSEEISACLRQATANAWCYRSDLHISFLKIWDNQAVHRIILEYAEATPLLAGSAKNKSGKKGGRKTKGKKK